MHRIKFKDFITLQRGFDLPKKDRIDGEYPVVASTSITGYHNEFKVEPPGVTTGRSGSLGEVLYLEKNFWPLNTSLWVKDFKGNLPHYVYYFLKTLNLQDYNSGAGVPTLNRNHLDNIEIDVHDENEQQIIASILSAFDDLIENNTRRIEILEEMARLIYREWFVHYRYPGHENDEMVNSGTEFGEIPEGWEILEAQNLIDFNPRTSIDKDKERPYLPMGGVSENSMVVDDSEVEFRTGGSGTKFQNMDTLFARITPSLENGKTGFVQFLNDGQIATGSTEFIVMRSKELNPYYVYCLARNDQYRETAIKSMAGASGRQRVRVNSIKEYNLPLPSRNVLDAFDRKVNPMFEQIHILTEHNKKLKETRDLLLPKLISGKVKV